MTDIQRVFDEAMYEQEECERSFNEDEREDSYELHTDGRTTFSSHLMAYGLENRNES